MLMTVLLILTLQMIPPMVRYPQSCINKPRYFIRLNGMKQIRHQVKAKATVKKEFKPVERPLGHSYVEIVKRALPCPLMPRSLKSNLKSPKRNHLSRKGQAQDLILILITLRLSPRPTKSWPTKILQKRMVIRQTPNPAPLAPTPAPLTLSPVRPTLTLPPLVLSPSLKLRPRILSNVTSRIPNPRLIWASHQPRKRRYR
ncbi:hypothetical protein EDB19DRAFT_1665659 [Suillus lakei]|nr:hypothetical protein EDB19DRAFT_1665659 [Suillus lakei]